MGRQDILSSPIHQWFSGLPWWPPFATTRSLGEIQKLWPSLTKILLPGLTSHPKREPQDVADVDVVVVFICVYDIILLTAIVPSSFPSSSSPYFILLIVLLLLLFFLLLLLIIIIIITIRILSSSIFLCFIVILFLLNGCSYFSLS